MSRPEAQAPTPILEKTALEISPFLKTECPNSSHLPSKLGDIYDTISDLTPPSSQTSANLVVKQLKAPVYFFFSSQT